MPVRQYAVLDTVRAGPAAGGAGAGRGAGAGAGALALGALGAGAAGAAAAGRGADAMELCRATGAAAALGAGGVAGAGAGAAAGASSVRLPGRFSAKILSTSLLATESGSAAEAADTRPTGASMPTKQAVKTRLKMNLQLEETANKLLSPVTWMQQRKPSEDPLRRSKKNQGLRCRPPVRRRLPDGLPAGFVARNRDPCPLSDTYDFPSARMTELASFYVVNRVGRIQTTPDAEFVYLVHKVFSLAFGRLPKSRVAVIGLRGGFLAASGGAVQPTLTEPLVEQEQPLGRVPDAL